jgi:predicted O-linked N-acetylglucosamine transferase (SPINDLY family)
VFAPRVAYSDYLARYRLGDLFLDSFPFNAGATASDALWAGLPVLTCSGEAFASRMAGSLLTATGLTELIATTPQAYEALAIELATHPTKLRDIKRKLSESRVTAPLCDTQLFVKNIEAAYTAMYERDRAGQPPDHIHLPRELV